MLDLTIEQIKSLSEKRSPGCVSIYLPMHKAGKEIQQNPIRLKNVLKEAEEVLKSNEKSSAEIREIFAPAERLIEDHTFWQRQSEGLALFLADGDRFIFRLPRKFEPLSVVSNRFHIKPLLPILGSDGRFFILALSLGEVRMMQGSQYGVSEVEMDGFPDGISGALAYDDPEKQLQHQTLTRTGGGQPGIFHGHGDNYETDKTIRRYLHKVDDQVKNLLQDDQAPLVVACVDYLLPIYEEVNTYHPLVEESIPGNPEELSPEELREEAWKIIEPYFKQEQADAISRYHLAASTSQGSDRLDEIVPAAYYKRVDTLFVALGVQKWGTFDPEKNTVRTDTEMTFDNDDLLDFAAVHTLRNNGKIYVMGPEKVPGTTEIAAILRY